MGGRRWVSWTAAVGLLALSVTAGGGAAATARTAAAAAPATGGRYVALGDSYAAGLGLGDPIAGTPPSCGRSAQNYPHQVAAALHLDLVDVTCSSAVVPDFITSQRAGGQSLPPQFDALTADTRLVTVTIGGNDLGFGTITSYCASLAGPNGPVLGDSALASCRQHFAPDGSDQLADTLRRQVTPELTAALAAIKAKAPSAAVVVVDYPALVPDAAHTPAGGCWANPLSTPNALPFTDADLPYLEQTEVRLDRAMADVATAAGAGVGDVFDASLPHTACGSDPWVNGVTLDGTALRAGSLHPTTAGASAMAAAAVAAARPLLAGARPSPAPTIGDGSGGPPAWLWPVVAVVAVVLLLVVVGLLRVARRRRVAPPPERERSPVGGG